MKHALVLVALATVGCGASGSVVRVYDGRVVEGSYVPPDAYAAYLRGVLAEESGDLAGAISAYAQAAEIDDEDPAIHARLGEARCKADPRDRGADAAFARARRLDPGYAGTLAAESRCAALRGNHEAATELAARAAAEDPKSVAIDALLVRAEAWRSDTRSRQHAIELTIAHGDHAVAWDALVTWARSRHDAELFARGLLGMLVTAPSRSADVEAGALELLGEGQPALARVVAGAVADAPREHGVRGPRDETVARLAVDEAIARGDEPAALRRATRGRVELVEVAARALVLERRDVAERAARKVADADPGSSAARMVLGALGVRTDLELRAATDTPPDLCALVLAERIAVAAGSDVARAWLEKVPRRRLAAHDPLGAVAVDLAARGVLPESDLPVELRVELAARRREAPPGPASSRASDALDARHELLRLALTDPKGAAARALFSRLEAAAAGDPVVAFALTRMALADVALRDAAALLLRKALLAAPSDALLLSAFVDFTKKHGGQVEDLGPARSRLMAVARTPAERALAAE